MLTYLVDISTHLSYTQDGLNNKSIAEINPFRYRSYYFDSETKLYYLNSRYYDPETGRFINADNFDVLFKTLDEFNGLNLYAYCFNNPVNTFDVDGQMAWWKKLLIGLAFIIVGAIVTAATAGTGTGFFATLGSALLTSFVQAGVSAAVSAGIGAVVGGISSAINGESFWTGALNGAIDGAVDGFMWGGIFAGGSQILGSIIPKTSGFKIGNHEFMYGTDKSKTLLSINNKLGSSRFRIDIGPGSKSTKIFNGLHLHFGATSKIRSIHRFILPAVINGTATGIISALKRILAKV